MLFKQDIIIKLHIIIMECDKMNNFNNLDNTFVNFKYIYIYIE